MAHSHALSIASIDTPGAPLFLQLDRGVPLMVHFNAHPGLGRHKTRLDSLASAFIGTKPWLALRRGALKYW